MTKITVFTPTYNRGYIIEQLYNSLKRQTYTDFEWLVVDDGSIDNTESLFSNWVKEDNQFNIRYYKKENGGKCRAINYALSLAKGTLFFIVDSDDYLTKSALEKIVKWEQNIVAKSDYCGVAGNLGISENETPNTIFPKEFYEGTLLDRYNVVDGERAIVFYTDIHKKYLYPEFDDEKFMTEAVVYNRMANDGYKMRFYNDIIYVYEYREDGLTKSGADLFLNNPRGYGLWLKEKAEFEHLTFSKKMKMYYAFTCDLINRYHFDFIAEIIGAPYFLILMFVFIHKCKMGLKNQV